MNLKNLNTDELKQLAKTCKEARDTKRVQARKLQSKARVATQEYEKLEEELDEIRALLKERRNQQLLQEGEWYKEREQHNILTISYITKISNRRAEYRRFIINTKTNHLYMCDGWSELQDMASIQKLTKRDCAKYALLIKSGASLFDGYSYKILQNKIINTMLTRDEIVTGKTEHKQYEPIDWDPAMPEGNYR